MPVLLAHFIRPTTIPKISPFLLLLSLSCLSSSVIVPPIIIQLFSLIIPSISAPMKVFSSFQAPPQPIKRIKNYSYNPSNLLGAGNFSKVYSGRNETTGEMVAIKIVEMSSLKTPKLQELHRSELQVLMKINHPHVLKCHDIFSDERQCFIITEVCNGGDLDMFVKKEGFLTEEKAGHFIKDIFEGLTYLAENSIVHRDLKVANIFINNGRAKIADFGFAVYAKQKFRDLNIGSPLYMSPQGYIDCIYGPKTDVWAFGILIYELLHGDTPYSFCKLQNDLRYHLSLPFDRSKVRSTITSDLKEVIYRCLEIDQAKRISIAQLRDTNYFRRLYYFAQGQLEEITHPIYTRVDRMHSSQGFQQLSNHSQSKGIQIKTNQVRNRQSPSMMAFPQTTRAKTILLEVPKDKDTVRLGRPISTQRQVIKLNPPPANRERLKSIDSKKPVQKHIIMTTIINFKAAVNLLHYCRGLFRCLQLMIAINEGENEIKYLTGWLILILQELNRKLNQNEVVFEGENSETKSKKLREVRNEYERKYVNQLKNYISSFINKPSLEDIKLYFFLQYRKYDIALQQEQQQPSTFLELGHLIVILYDSTRLLKRCQEESNFARFINYKDIESMLSWTKDKFSMSSYVGFKKRMIINA